MSDNFKITAEELCVLFNLESVPRYPEKGTYVSHVSVRPFSMPWNMVKKSCVELAPDSYQDLQMNILNQFEPLGRGFKWRSMDQDIQVDLKKKKMVYIK